MISLAITSNQGQRLMKEKDIKQDKSSEQAKIR
jgi:hypothetical protein